MMTESSASSIRTDGMHQGEAKVSTTITAIILVLTVFGILGLSGCDSQVEEDKASDWTTKVAATIDGHDITEADVNDFIEKYRKAYGHTTDASWATFLDSQGKTASDYRDLAIEQLEERYLVQRLACLDSGATRPHPPAGGWGFLCMGSTPIRVLHER